MEELYVANRRRGAGKEALKEPDSNSDVNHNHYTSDLTEGLYPQSDGSLVVVDIDASKGFVDRSFAIFAIFDLKRQLKLLEMAFDQVQTCLILPFRWAHFLIKNSRKAQWVHTFTMNFNGFRSVCLYLSL